MFGLFPGQETTTANTVFQLLGIAVDLACAVYLSKPEIVGIFDPDSLVEVYQIRE